MAPQTPSTAVLPHALHIPGINKLSGKRVVLASGSPRRKDILQIFVRLMVFRNSRPFNTTTRGSCRASLLKSYPRRSPKILTPRISKTFTNTPSLPRRTKPWMYTSDSSCGFHLPSSFFSSQTLFFFFLSACGPRKWSRSRNRCRHGRPHARPTRRFRRCIFRAASCETGAVREAHE